MNENKYEKLINIVNQDYAESKKVNEAVKLLTQLELTDIQTEHYTVIEDFIIFIVNHTDISETNKNLLDKPLDYIRNQNI